MGLRAPSMGLVSSHVAEVPIDAALAVAGFGGPPRVVVRASNERIDVDVEMAQRLQADAVNDDRWWLLRSKRGVWPARVELSIDLGVEGVFVTAPDGALLPYPGTTTTIRVSADRCTTPPSMRFSPTTPQLVPHMTWPGNPPEWVAQVLLADLASEAGPIVEVTLRVRAGEKTFDRSGWIEIARPIASWSNAVEGETVVGARLRDLAGNVVVYGEKSP